MAQDMKALKGASTSSSETLSGEQSQPETELDEFIAWPLDISSPDVTDAQKKAPLQPQVSLVGSDNHNVDEFVHEWPDALSFPPMRDPAFDYPSNIYGANEILFLGHIIEGVSSQPLSTPVLATNQESCSSDQIDEYQFPAAAKPHKELSRCLRDNAINELNSMLALTYHICFLCLTFVK